MRQDGRSVNVGPRHEQGTLAITIEGVDHVISMSRTTQAERLLIAKPGDGD